MNIRNIMLIENRLFLHKFQKKQAKLDYDSTSQNNYLEECVSMGWDIRRNLGDLGMCYFLICILGTCKITFYKFIQETL